MKATIRRASSADAPVLSDLAFRSKASWGYTHAFMERIRPSLAVSAEYIAQSPVYVLMVQENVVGFFGFLQHSGETVLNDFWIGARSIGNGYGRVMWRHAVSRARANGFRSFLIQSDPTPKGSTCTSARSVSARALRRNRDASCRSCSIVYRAPLRSKQAAER